MNANLKQAINDGRVACLQLGDVVKHIKEHPSLKASLAAVRAPSGEDPSEAVANLTLAYRHIEYARMRLGKAIQAMEGGVSILDKDPYAPKA